jgi:hypothetical protein
MAANEATSIMMPAPPTNPDLEFADHIDWLKYIDDFTRPYGYVCVVQ